MSDLLHEYVPGNMAEQTDSKPPATEDRKQDCDLVEQTDSKSPATEDRKEDCDLVEQTDSKPPATEDRKEDCELVEQTDSKSPATEDRKEDCDLVEQTDSKSPATEDRKEDCDLVEQTVSNPPATEDRKQDCDLVEQTVSNPPATEDRKQDCDLLEQTDSKPPATEERKEDCDLLEQTDSKPPATEERKEDCDLVEQTDSKPPATEERKEDCDLEPTKFLQTSFSKDIDEYIDFTLKFDQNSVIMILVNLLKTKTSRSPLETLLILHHCFNTTCLEYGCNLNDILLPYQKIRKMFTLMNRILWFILNNDSERLVKLSVADCNLDYKLNAGQLLKCRLSRAYKFIKKKVVLSPKMNNRLTATLKKCDSLILVIFTRYGWNCMKKFRQSENTTHVNHYSRRFQLNFLKYYEECAGIGRFPHVFWQDASFEKKIKNNNSLEAIFLIGDEDKCSVCYKDGQDFRDDFAIFLNCKHIICVSCAEWLIIVEFDYFAKR